MIASAGFSNRNDIFAKPAIITQFMHKGDMKSYLQNTTKSSTVTTKALMAYAKGVAEGIAHLHTYRFIHRDMAARNCLLDDRFVIKIADFGLTQEAEDYNYAAVQSELQIAENEKEKLPVFWLAPEVFTQHLFSNASDTWAFAVTVWEFFTRCQQPYATWGPEWQEKLMNGYRLRKPLYVS